ncbi:MAG: hypothetical protein HON90_02025 [Halobacteriovoraceae bacterium]|jgi:hypothetical protein|nr:hypothetical protein [Halobacteriovoraceae bacterium]
MKEILLIITVFTSISSKANRLGENSIENIDYLCHYELDYNDIKFEGSELVELTGISSRFPIYEWGGLTVEITKSIEVHLTFAVQFARDDIEKYKVDTSVEVLLNDMDQLAYMDGNLFISRLDSPRGSISFSKSKVKIMKGLTLNNFTCELKELVYLRN